MFAPLLFVQSFVSSCMPSNNAKVCASLSHSASNQHRLIDATNLAHKKHVRVFFERKSLGAGGLRSLGAKSSGAGSRAGAPRDLSPEQGGLGGAPRDLGPEQGVWRGAPRDLGPEQGGLEGGPRDLGPKEGGLGGGFLGLESRGGRSG